LHASPSRRNSPPPPAPAQPLPDAAPPSSRYARLAPGVAVAAVLTLFFAPALLGGGEFTYRDTGRLHVPMKQWIGEELARGRLPEWNPYAGLGAPVLGNMIDAVLHPFTVLTVLLPPDAAMRWWVLLSFALAAAGMLAWARQLGASGAASAIAALAFALSGPLVSSSDNVTYLTAYAALPSVFAAAHRHARSGGPGPLLLVVLASATCAAAGDPQAWSVAVGLLPAYAALVAAPEGGRRRALARGLLATAAAAVAAAPFVLPVAAWLPSTRRFGGLSGDDLVRWSLHPRRLAELVVPELFRGAPADPIASPAFSAYCGNDVTQNAWFLSVYLGVSVLLLAAIAVARDRRARALAAAAAVFAWAALGHHAGFTRIVTAIPIVGSFRFWEKVTVWIALFAAAAAARGVDAVLDSRAFPRWARRAAAVGAAALLAVAAVAALAPGVVRTFAGGPPAAGAALAENVARGAFHAGAALALFAVLAAALQRGRLSTGRPAAIALGAVVALDLVGGNSGAYVLGPPSGRARPPLAAGAAVPASRIASPFTMREDRWPELGRVASTWEWGRRTLLAPWNVPLRVGSPGEYVGMHEARWAEYRARTTAGRDVAKLGLFGFDHVVVPKEPGLATAAGLAPPFDVRAQDGELPAFLVAMPHRPRAYVADVLRGVAADEALRFALAGGEPGVTVVEGAVPPAYAPPVAASVAWVRDAPEDVELAVRSDRPALVVLSDANVPGWGATVDGRPAPIVAANWAARGVWVDAGEHRLRFRYAAPGLAAGCWIAALGAVALSGWVFLRRVRAGRPAGV
jgi:hypothetical protein